MEPEVFEEGTFIGTYLDGGTVSIKVQTKTPFQFDETTTIMKKSTVEVFIDKRIRTETPFAVFPCHPSKGEPIQTMTELVKAKSLLINSVPYYNCPNQLIAITNGILWIDEQLEALCVNEQK